MQLQPSCHGSWGRPLLWLLSPNFTIKGVESLAPYCVKDDDKNGQFSFSIMHGIYFATQPMMEDLSTKV